MATISKDRLSELTTSTSHPCRCRIGRCGGYFRVQRSSSKQSRCLFDCYDMYYEGSVSSPQKNACNNSNRTVHHLQQSRRANPSKFQIPLSATSFGLTATMSSLRLPAELMDHIFDLLRYSIDELESCCLVSKSWVPHARKHLFAAITLHTPENLRSWKTLFPGPSTSPACFIRSLSIDLAHVVTAPDAEEGGWIQTFSHVVHLKVHISKTDSYEGLVPFHGFSPLKSLSIVFFTSPSPRIFNLIYSFPPLENLSVTVYGCFSTIEDDAFDGQPTAIQSPDPPAFTGRLKLYLTCGMDLIAPRLLSLPNGLRFRRLDLRWHSDRDALLTRGLVEKCYSTLESFSIDVGLLSTSSIRLDPHQ